MPSCPAALWFLSIVSVHSTVFLKLHSQGRQVSSRERKPKTLKDAKVIVKDEIIPNGTVTVTKSVVKYTKGHRYSHFAHTNGRRSPSRSAGHRVGHHTTCSGSAWGSSSPTLDKNGQNQKGQDPWTVKTINRSRYLRCSTIDGLGQMLLCFES